MNALMFDIDVLWSYAEHCAAGELPFNHDVSLMDEFPPCEVLQFLFCSIFDEFSMQHISV